jgi:hypothetical protein
MIVPDRLVRIIAWTLAGLMLVGSLLVAWKRHDYLKQLRELRNKVATHEQTIEVQKGVWSKASLELDSLKKLLDSSKKDQVKLKDELNKSKADVLGLTEVSVKLRQDYEALLKAKQTEVPGVDGKPGRTKVEFDREFGPYRISGHTLTNPAEAYLKLAQHRPLRLTLVITQLEDKSWRTYAASSEDDVSIDIKLSAVNPYLLERKWYERIGFNAYLGGGTVAASAGAILGVGVTVDFSKFSLGPALWFSTTGLSDRFYGVSFTYRPFQRDR